MHNGVLTHLRAPRVRNAQQQLAFGPPLEGKLTDLVTAANANGLNVKSVGGEVQLYKVQKIPVLCVAGARGSTIPIVLSQNSVVNGPGELRFPTQNRAVCDRASLPGIGNDRHYVISLRSVEALFYYLGGLLESPDPNVPFTIARGISEDERIAVTYRGDRYFVRNAGRDDDATITIIAILIDLLNLNKDADEIPVTKTVATTQ